VVESTTSSLVTNFIKIGQGVFELQGSENWGLPLTWPVALTTVQHYRADCDNDCDILRLAVENLNCSMMGLSENPCLWLWVIHTKP